MYVVVVEHVVRSFYVSQTRLFFRSIEAFFIGFFG